MIKPDKNKLIVQEQKRDQILYFVEDGEAGFSPEKNKHIIDKTINKTDQIRKLKHQQFIDQLGERTDAVATYIKSRAAEGNTPLERYFGKQMMAKLRGEKIARILKGYYQMGGRKRKLYLPGD
jgi:hypothetical protein